MKIDVKTTKTRVITDFKGIGVHELIVLGKYNYNRVENNLEDHVHNDMIEICYYDKGSQWFAVNHNRYLVRGGDIFIHFPGEVHGSGGFPEAKGCLYWFIIKANKSKRHQGDHENIGYLVNELVNLKRRHFRGGFVLKKMLEDVFNAIKAKGETQQIKKIRIALLTQLFLLKIMEYANKKSNDTDNERLQKVYHLIDSRLTEYITIADLAKEANLSQSRFKNWFKELSGFTPVDYVQRKRVDYAIQKLKESPSTSIKDLAYELNFSSQQYFSTVVKKFTGKSPGELRS
ncbi:AraC family transcriptional regulator [Chitinophaga sp. MM2321]|uniref:helix-turn-helix domain-containing protein n=1 Tax=Chitinophaga sp. MM2321 TaxID=3137178 RepID=UPI0032D58312